MTDSPRDILNANKSASEYVLSKDLLGTEFTITNKMEELKSDFSESGTRLWVTIELEGSELTWQPSAGVANNEIATLRDHDGLPVTCKLETYPTSFGGEGYKLIFPGEAGY